MCLLGHDCDPSSLPFLVPARPAQCQRQRSLEFLVIRIVTVVTVSRTLVSRCGRCRAEGGSVALVCQWSERKDFEWWWGRFGGREPSRLMKNPLTNPRGFNGFGRTAAKRFPKEV